VYANEAGSYTIKATLSSDPVSDALVVTEEGNVGIGIDDPQDRLDVDGYVRSNGVRLTSDARWKENVEAIDDVLLKISQLRGVSFEWIDPSRGSGRQIGVIAQEVEEVFPEVVHTDSQGYKSVEYSKLVAPLIEAVKALQAEIEALRSENARLALDNNALRQVNQSIETRLDKLEQLLSDN
jgi:trimeric autotransporter adhesin